MYKDMTPIIIEDSNRMQDIIRAVPYYLDLTYSRIMDRVLWWIQEIFRRQGPDVIFDPITKTTYHRWTELAESTVKKKHGDRTILIDSGIMRNSLQIIDVERGEKRWIGRLGIYSGPALKYAKAHEFGASITMQVTERMRNYFLALFLEEKRQNPTKSPDEFSSHPLKKTTKEIHVRLPERSFMRAGLIEASNECVALVIAVLEGVLDGVLK